MWVVDLRVLDWITGEESSLYESSLLRRDRVQGYPTISPDSRWLLFSAFLRDFLWTIQPETGNLVRLTGAEFLGETSPAYSPNGTRVAFVASDDRANRDKDIWVSDIGFENPVKVTNKPAQYSDVYWLTDGQSTHVHGLSRGSIKLQH